MKWLSRLLMSVGMFFMMAYGYTTWDHHNANSVTLDEAKTVLESKKVQAAEQKDFDIENFTAQKNEAFGVLTIPKLGNLSIGVVEGADADSLRRGVGHISSTAFPGQGEQIVLSGHRDTVFRNFDQIEVGDRFIVEMPYGTYEYEIYQRDIVDADDRTVIRKMGEEVLVVTTCYPFEMYGFAPDRAIFYSRPVNK